MAEWLNAKHLGCLILKKSTASQMVKV
jgi:hypothetical protein